MESEGAITVGAGATVDDLDAEGAVTLGAGVVYHSAEGNPVALGAGAHITGALPPPPADFGGETFGIGTYKRTAATSLTGTVTLDASEVVTGESKRC
jgi:hypothetical protein